MQVTKEPLESCQVALTIEVETDKVAGAVDKAYREYSKYVAVPGFRKGKAPMSFVRQRVPESDVRQRTAELLVEPAYEEALKQEAITPYAPPKLELVQLEFADKPFIFKAVVPLAPQVELGPYTGLTVEHKKYELAEEDVDKQVERMRERAADYPQVERPVAQGDLVVADVGAVVEARPEAAEPRGTMIEIGADNIPGFDEQIVGLSPGETKEFTLTYPNDYPDDVLAGETADFTVLVKEVRAKEVPALDDELAKKLTNGKTETLDGLKEILRTDMGKELAQSADREAEASLIDQIVNGSKIEFPPVLVESEVDNDARQLQAQIEKQNATFADYLQQTGQTQEQVLTNMQAAADKRIRIGLVLGEIAGKENLEINDADMDAAIAEQAEQRGTSPAAMRALLETNDGMTNLMNRAQTKKVLDFLRASAIMEERVVQAGAAIAEAEDQDDFADDETDEELEVAEPLEEAE